MKNFFEKPTEKLFDLHLLTKEKLLYYVLPRLLMEIMRKYFRLEVEGLENLPKKGPCLVIPNHSGFSGFDALVLANEIHRHTGRVPKIMTHHFWFLSEKLAIPAQRMGFYEATTANGLELLGKGNIVTLFPEGEQGNFKPTAKRYQLQEFKRGFVRLALKTESPIIPALIIGAEETHINLSTFKFSKYLKGMVLPLPLNVIPLPVKWKIRFFDPIHLPFHPNAADDTEFVHGVAREIQERMQRELRKEVRDRGSIF